MQALFFFCVGIRSRLLILNVAALEWSRGALEGGDGKTAGLVGEQQAAEDDPANTARFPGIEDALVVVDDILERLADADPRCQHYSPFSSSSVLW